MGNLVVFLACLCLLNQPLIKAELVYLAVPSQSAVSGDFVEYPLYYDMSVFSHVEMLSTQLSQCNSTVENMTVSSNAFAMAKLITQPASNTRMTTDIFTGMSLKLANVAAGYVSSNVDGYMVASDYRVSNVVAGYANGKLVGGMPQYQKGVGPNGCSGGIWRNASATDQSWSPDYITACECGEGPSSSTDGSQAALCSVFSVTTGVSVYCQPGIPITQVFSQIKTTRPIMYIPQISSTQPGSFPTLCFHETVAYPPVKDVHYWMSDTCPGTTTTGPVRVDMSGQSFGCNNNNGLNQLPGINDFYRGVCGTDYFESPALNNMMAGFVVDTSQPGQVTLTTDTAQITLFGGSIEQGSGVYGYSNMRCGAAIKQSFSSQYITAWNTMESYYSGRWSDEYTFLVQQRVCPTSAQLAWLPLVSSLLSGLALGVSIYAAYESYEAKKYAQEALSVSRSALTAVGTLTTLVQKMAIDMQTTINGVETVMSNLASQMQQQQLDTMDNFDKVNVALNSVSSFLNGYVVTSVVELQAEQMLSTTRILTAAVAEIVNGGKVTPDNLLVSSAVEEHCKVYDCTGVRSGCLAGIQARMVGVDDNSLVYTVRIPVPSDPTASMTVYRYDSGVYSDFTTQTVVQSKQPGYSLIGKLIPAVCGYYPSEFTGQLQCTSAINAIQILAGPSDMVTTCEDERNGAILCAGTTLRYAQTTGLQGPLTYKVTLVEGCTYMCDRFGENPVIMHLNETTGELCGVPITCSVQSASPASAAASQLGLSNATGFTETEQPLTSLIFDQTFVQHAIVSPNFTTLAGVQADLQQTSASLTALQAQIQDDLNNANMFTAPGDLSAGQILQSLMIWLMLIAVLYLIYKTNANAGRIAALASCAKDSSAFKIVGAVAAVVNKTTVGVPAVYTPDSCDAEPGHCNIFSYDSCCSNHIMFANAIVWPTMLFALFITVLYALKLSRFIMDWKTTPEVSEDTKLKMTVKVEASNPPFRRVTVAQRIPQAAVRATVGLGGLSYANAQQMCEEVQANNDALHILAAIIVVVMFYRITRKLVAMMKEQALLLKGIDETLSKTGCLKKTVTITGNGWSTAEVAEDEGVSAEGLKVNWQPGALIKTAVATAMATGADAFRQGCEPGNAGSCADTKETAAVVIWTVTMVLCIPPTVVLAFYSAKALAKGTRNVMSSVVTSKAAISILATRLIPGADAACTMTDMGDGCSQYVGWLIICFWSVFAIMCALIVIRIGCAVWTWHSNRRQVQNLQAVMAGIQSKQATPMQSLVDSLVQMMQERMETEMKGVKGEKAKT